MRQNLECPTCRTRINSINELIKLFLDFDDDLDGNATSVLRNIDGKVMDLTLAQTTSYDKLNEITKMIESVTINMTKYDDKVIQLNLFPKT